MDLSKFKSFARSHEQKVISNFDVWLYTRVSSRDQESNRSLDSQNDEGHKYALKNGYTITTTFGATYESASGDFTRKEFMKLIETVRKAKKKPYAILIYTMSRFSRSGGGGISLAHELVDELGVNLIEVATGKNTTTDEGKLEIYSGLIRASQDNIDRLKVTVPGMIKMLEAGHWLGCPPPGYLHFGPRVNEEYRFAHTQRIEKGPEAVFIRRAWEMKLEGHEDYIILRDLARMGFHISKQKLNKMWRNPFYCGVSTNKLLDGRIVKGSWEKMVSEKEFFKVQEIIQSKRLGKSHKPFNIHRPLMGFLRCDKCENPMSGYQATGRTTQYYRCAKCAGETLNADTTKTSRMAGAHNLFIEFLEGYTLPEHLVEPFRLTLREIYTTLTGEKLDEETALNREVEKLQGELKQLQRKYALEGLEKSLYLEFKSELESKIAELNHTLHFATKKSANIEKYLDACTHIARNTSKYWASEGFEIKRKLQQLVFPEGIFIEVKKRAVRTSEVNMIFNLTASIRSYWEPVNENSPVEITEESLVVAGGRFELPTFGL